MSFNFDPSAGESESSSSIDLKRRLAAALLQQGGQTTPIQSPWQGVARLSESLMGGLALRRQAAQEQEANAQVMAAITGQPYTPPAAAPSLFGSLFGGGKGVPAASDAQGQVAATNPSPATVSPVPSSAASVSASPDATDLNGYLSDPARRSTLPAGMRNNNPGNIKFVGQQVPGLVGPSQNTDEGDPQAVFATPEAGLNAMHQLLLKKYNGGKITADQIIAGNGGWTPGNHQAAANVAHYAGLSPDQDINLNDPIMAAKFMRGLMMQEHGKMSSLYPDSMIVASIGGQPQGTNQSTGYAPLPQPTPAEQAIQQQMPQQVASLDPGAGIPAPGAAGQMQANNPAPAPQTPAQQPPMPQAAPVPAPQPIPQAAAPQPDAPPQQKLAQALQSQGTVGGNPLAGNPRAQALMQAVMNPYASPQARSLAGAMLQQTMQPHTQLITNPNTGTTYLVNTITGEKQLVDQGQTADSELEKDASGLPMGTFNKRTGQYTPLANAPQGLPGLPAGVAPTDDYKNWQISRASGDQRSFADYQADLRKAGAQSVTLAGETEESKALGQARAKNVVNYMEAGPDARNKMQTLQIMADALKAGNGNFSTGPGAEAILNAKQAIGNFLGTNLDGVAPAEIYKKMGAYLASSAAKDLAQRPTQFDFKTFLQNNPGLDISPQGNEFMINIMQQQAQHQMDLSQMAQSYKGPTADWNDVVAQYDKTHPIMSPITGKPLDPSEKMFPGGQQQNQSAPGAKPAPPVGTIEQGYRFKGGDPSKPENWEQAL